MRRTSILAARAFKRRLIPNGQGALTQTNQRSAVAPSSPPPSAVSSVGTPGGGGFMGAIAEGFAFGVGSSIARSMVGSLWPGGGGGDSAPSSSTPPPPTDNNGGFSHNYDDADQNKQGGGGGGGDGDDDDDLF